MIILSSVYRILVTNAERILPLSFRNAIKWEHPAGPKTIHFWVSYQIKVFFERGNVYL